MLQWLVACAAQWAVLEPALALLLSLTSCISARLLALPEQDEMVAQFQASKAATLPQASPLAALGPRGEAVRRSARHVWYRTVEAQRK